MDAGLGGAGLAATGTGIGATDAGLGATGVGMGAYGLGAYGTRKKTRERDLIKIIFIVGTGIPCNGAGIGAGVGAGGKILKRDLI